MCEVAPGPRCSFDMSNRLDARIKAYNNALKCNPQNIAELNILKMKVVVAQEDYDTTPGGLEQLKKQLKENPAEIIVQQRLTKATLTREQQTLALEEIRNSRAVTISSLYTQLVKGYDNAETFSVLETAREEAEKSQLLKVSSGGSAQVFSDDETRQEKYTKLLDNLEEQLPEQKNKIAKLRKMEPPQGVHLEVYESLHTYFGKSKTQLKHQINEIATIQNTTPAIAEAFYKAYRDQYIQNYLNKPLAEQPNPPAHWVKGEFNHSGYSQSPTSKFAPHDKASMYAVYRLRADDNAIPNYMKQTKQYILIKTDKTNLVFTTYTPQGKKVREINLSTESHPTLLQQQLTGKTLLQTQATPSYLIPQSTINQNDYISKHFDLPSYQTSGITSQILPEASNPLEIHLAARKKIKKVWNNKPARANAPTLSIDAFDSIK